MSDTVTRFFAITRTKRSQGVSTYDIQVINGQVVCKKIAVRGDSLVKVGHELERSSQLIIGDQLFVFNRPLRPNIYVEASHMLDHSSPIVALFNDKENADLCFNSNDLKRYNERWRKQTDEVLSDIGTDHKFFCINANPLSGLRESARRPESSIVEM